MRRLWVVVPQEIDPREDPTSGPAEPAAGLLAIVEECRRLKASELVLAAPGGAGGLPDDDMRVVRLPPGPPGKVAHDLAPDGDVLVELGPSAAGKGLILDAARAFRRRNVFLYYSGDAGAPEVVAYRKGITPRPAGESLAGLLAHLKARLKARWIVRGRPARKVPAARRGRKGHPTRGVIPRGEPEPPPPDFSDAVEEVLSLAPAPGEPLVAAVVPLFRSEKVVERCLRSLRRALPGVSVIVAVDDGSPDRSADVACRVLGEFGRGICVRLSRNTGYPHAVNVGARLTKAEFLLLVNADVFLQRGSLEPMLRLVQEDPSTAVVGNRQVLLSGRVDGEGSEFSWPSRSYAHVGRDIEDPVPGDSLVKERDAVTFACALVRHSLWRELRGLDERYRVAYFEDTDFCLRARARGYKVLSTTESRVAHVGRHSGAGFHRFYGDNARLFQKRWVGTGEVFRLARKRGLRLPAGRVVVCMIACSEEEFVAAALQSVYELADSIVVVEGGTRFAVEAGLCDERGRSTDRTVEEVESFPDPDGKLELIRAPGRPWRDKLQMRAAYAARLRPGDVMLLLDADEVFDPEGLWRLAYLMHEADVVMPGFHLLWNDIRTVGTGVWDSFPQVKVVRWREGFGYRRDHNEPCDRLGRPVRRIPSLKVLRTPERLYFHYSWAGKTDRKLRKKAAYYAAQNRGLFPPDYMDRVFFAWRERPGEVERESGTHPYGGGGALPFAGRHPEPVERAVRLGKVAGELSPRRHGEERKEPHRQVAKDAKRKKEPERTGT